MTQRLAIVTPVYNDWSSLGQLLQAISREVADHHGVRVVAVNDGSSQPRPEGFLDRLELANPMEVELVDLTVNLGHQGAIAVGLSHVEQTVDCDAVVVMDCDGEDQPTDINRLVQAGLQQPGSVAFAARNKRQEGMLFKAFYFFYKLVFWISTGHYINFGNFCFIPKAALQRLVYIPDLWTNLACTVIKSRLPFQRILTDKGPRYEGRSQMNFTSHILHGLSGISIFKEVLCVRLLLLSTALFLASLAGLVFVFIIRLFTELYIPGWATYLATSLLMIMLLSIVLTIFSFLILRHIGNERSPLAAHEQFIMGIETR